MVYTLRNHAWRLYGVSLITAIAVGMLTPTFVCADEFNDFANAKNAFEAGEYEEAINRFNALLTSGIQNPSLILETHKLLGISYLFTKDTGSAEIHFTKLLTRSPDFSLDPLLYPIEVVDFFTAIKQKNQTRLNQIATVQAQEEQKRQAEAERRRKAELEKLKRNVYLEREKQQYSRLVAALPFGIGQFQNGHRLKGSLFLSFELFLAGTTITTYFLHAGLRAKPFDNPNARENSETREKVYRITNQVAIGLLAGTMAAGIVDSLYFFVPERIKWKKVKEQEVPETLRPGSKKSRTTFSISIGERDFFARIAGRF